MRLSHTCKLALATAGLVASAVAVPLEDGSNGVLSLDPILGDLAVNAPVAPAGQTLTVTEVAVPVDPLTHHPAIIAAKINRKYGHGRPANMSAAYEAAKAAAKGGGKGHVPADPDEFRGADRSYLSPVKFGGKILHVQFDTGSSDVWVYSNKQPAGQTQGHSIYDCTNIVKGEHWKIVYGDGSRAKGVVSRGSVSVGDLTVPSEGIECATSISKDLIRDTASDGIFGLAFEIINTAKPRKVATFFDNIKRHLAEPLFTAALRRGKPGTYGFGYIDHSLYTGKIKYANVDPSNGFWQVDVTGYGVGGSKTGNNLPFIVDTGTSITIVTDEFASKYYSKVRGASLSPEQGGYVFPCSAKLPTAVFYIGGVAHSVPGEFFNYIKTPDGCYGGLQPSSTAGINIGILGDTFLKSQFAVFDSRGPKVGFAPQKGA